MKALLKKYESVNMDEIIIEDGKEIKKSMPYLKLSCYIKPEEFPDVTAYSGAMIDLHRPEEYAQSSDGKTLQISKRYLDFFRIIKDTASDAISEAEETNASDGG